MNMNLFWRVSRTTTSRTQRETHLSVPLSLINFFEKKMGKLELNTGSLLLMKELGINFK